jgi:hypothetical protein
VSVVPVVAVVLPLFFRASATLLSSRLFLTRPFVNAATRLVMVGGDPSRSERSGRQGGDGQHRARRRSRQP